MSSSSVKRTPCCAGIRPVKSVARAGEHMHEEVKARSKVRPCRFSAVVAGMLAASQPTGKCIVARSWSEMKRTTFLER